MLGLARSVFKKALPQHVLVRQLRRQAGNPVLLTFDDGPDPEVTPAVLDWLAAHGARAIFFVVGRRIARAPHLLERICAEGHLLGNHSYAHPNDRGLGAWEYYQDLRRCQDLIEKFSHTRPRLYRPPCGRVSPAGLLAARLLGLTTMLWSLDADDWKCRTEEDAQRSAEMLVSRLAARDIVLLHDDNPQVLRILELLSRSTCARTFDFGSSIEQFG
jgi:peptidoglycan/xylan/chitin deacetylase (PgdA/CDA1 family)